MKNRTLLLSGILLVLIVAGIAFGIYVKVTAQPDIVSYLQERLRQQNVPVVEITILQQSPLRLQITIQSRSDGKKAMPEDPINLSLVSREVSLASQRGYVVERIVIVLLNNRGEPMGKTDESVNSQNMSLLSATTIDNTTVKNLINDRINLYGMSVTNMDISSSDGLQFVTLQLSTPSLETANQALPDFIPTLNPLLEDINTQGAQIATLRLELKDEQGNFLLNYITDLQLHSKNAWMADGLTTDWLPGVPPPAPE
ncbi:MAG: hypothetical protein WA821_01050 [Anaerolineales bacterium]